MLYTAPSRPKAGPPSPVDLMIDKGRCLSLNREQGVSKAVVTVNSGPASVSSRLERPSGVILLRYEAPLLGDSSKTVPWS